MSRPLAVSARTPLRLPASAPLFGLAEAALVRGRRLICTSRVPVQSRHALPLILTRPRHGRAKHYPITARHVNTKKINQPAAWIRQNVEIADASVCGDRLAMFPVLQSCMHQQLPPSPPSTAVSSRHKPFSSTGHIRHTTQSATYDAKAQSARSFVLHEAIRADALPITGV